MIDRTKLGRMFGAAGSTHENERLAALRAIDMALQASGLSWAWIADVIATGEVPSDERERLFDRLIRDRLAEGYSVQHRMTTVERACMGQVETMLAAGVAVQNIPIEDLVAATEVADQVRRRDPARGPRRVNWG